ncbi:MAG: hypothetical protein RL414_1313 [Actinomycetota bacterium]
MRRELHSTGQIVDDHLTNVVTSRSVLIAWIPEAENNPTIGHAIFRNYLASAAGAAGAAASAAGAAGVSSTAVDFSDK